MKRKAIALFFSLVLSFSLVACGSENNATPEANTQIEATEQTTPEPAVEVAPMETTEAVEPVEAETTEPETTDKIAPEETQTEATEQEESSQYTFTDMDEIKYAKTSVNVRNLPDTSGDKLGGLAQNDEIHITGQCNETGWFRFEYRGEEAYVSDSYLVSEKVEVPQPTEPLSNNSGNSENNNGKYTNAYGQTYGMTPQEVAAAFGQPIGSVIDGSYYYYIVSHIRGVDGIGFHALDNSFEWRVVGGTAYIVQTYDNGNFEVWKQSVAPN